MDNSNPGPIFLLVFFILRCVLPILFLLGISYILRRLGFISKSPPPPPELEENASQNNPNNSTGGFIHGST